MKIYSQSVPEVLYYRFENNYNSSTPNYAIPGRGNPLASLVSQQFGAGGQFDSCLVGMGGTNNYLNSGWSTNLGNNPWTISLWINNIQNLNPTYLFGAINAGQFRCFYGGAAGSNNLLLRGNFADVLVTNVMPGPTVIHFVYDGSNIIVYKNGSFYHSYSRPGISLNGAGPFKIGGYGTTGDNSLNTGGRIDEFRVYSRALSASEIAMTWDIELGYVLPGNAICKSNINKLIPNYGVIYDTINVAGLPGSACLTKVSLLLDTVNHQRDGDLIFRLSHLNTNVTVVNRVGGTGSNFLKTYLADSGNCYIGSLGCNIPPYSGSFKISPGDSLARFKYQNPNGPWVLSITDTVNGQSGTLKAWCIVLEYMICTGIPGNSMIPKNYFLEQNYPNPFNPSTRIKYGIPKAENVSITLYDINGKEVAKLVNGFKSAGTYNIDFNASALSSGVYLYKISAGSYTETKKMMVVK